MKSFRSSIRVDGSDIGKCLIIYVSGMSESVTIPIALCKYIFNNSVFNCGDALTSKDLPVRLNARAVYRGTLYSRAA